MARMIGSCFLHVGHQEAATSISTVLPAACASLNDFSSYGCAAWTANPNERTAARPSKGLITNLSIGLHSLWASLVTGPSFIITQTSLRAGRTLRANPLS